MESFQNSAKKPHFHPDKRIANANLKVIKHSHLINTFHLKGGWHGT
jgi:hypothetical protein